MLFVLSITCSLLQFHISFHFLHTSFESCDLEIATAILTYHITHYATQAIMHAHFGSVETNLNYRMFSIYGTSSPCAATTKTQRHSGAENDMLE
jgi:secreted trypsin-like serine protease